MHGPASLQTANHPAIDQVWGWLEEIPDPEIPVISVVDLGIVRDLRWVEDELVVTITPTYCGCPAIQMIEQEIRNALHRHGVESLRLETRLAPAWSTDWMSERGRLALRSYGIAPPAQQAIDVSGLRRRLAPTRIGCPRCGSNNTVCLSPFGSTACKALYRCNDCLEPFDYFKSH